MNSEKELLKKCKLALEFKEDVISNKASKSWPVATLPIDMYYIMNSARDELKEYEDHYRAATLKAENIQLTKTQISKLNSPNTKAVLTINIPIYNYLWCYVDNTLAYILDCPRQAFKIVEYRTPLTPGKMANVNHLYVAMHPDFVKWGLLGPYVDGLDETMATAERERDLFYKSNTECLEPTFTSGLLIQRLCKELSITPKKLQNGENRGITDYKGWEYRHCWASNAGIADNELCRELIHEFLGTLSMQDNIVAFMYDCAGIAFDKATKLKIVKR